MMKMTFKAFSKKLFGVKYERLTRTLFVYLILYLGLHTADFKLEIAPLYLYWMAAAFTGGVMLQALSSEDNAACLRNMLMLPFRQRDFVFSYTAALGTYTFLTKTAVLLVIVSAVSVRTPGEILTCVLCAAWGVFTAAALFSLRKYWYAVLLLASVMAAMLIIFQSSPWFWAAGLLLSLLILLKADGYAFYLEEGGKKKNTHKHRRYSVLRYLLRYVSAHKNYLLNTAVMWGAASVLPLLFRQTEGLFVVLLGFAILSLNTPVCILLSCDPALEQALRILPGRAKMFLAPYCLFLFLCNIIADSIFLCSFWIQTGYCSGLMICAAVFFALQSAVCSVLLEWFYPIRGWKIESDLWHHPRKYLVPAVMLLLAGAAGIVPMIIPLLLAALFAEVIVLYFY